MRAPASLVPCLVLAGCRYLGGGLEAAPDGGLPLPRGPEGGAGAGGAAADVAAAANDAAADRRFDLSWAPGDGPAGPPAEIGCADGTREGFLDARAWRSIAACAGAWQVPGLLDERTRRPQCDRGAGNTGLHPGGAGCAVADLCAEGWHVCDGPDDVARSSPTGCESAAREGHLAFFVARVGATASGICTVDSTAANDLHGCGTLGQPASAACQPLERRLGFADCLGTSGVWSCGGEKELISEASMVVKAASTLGGALCCRDR